MMKATCRFFWRVDRGYTAEQYASVRRQLLGLMPEVAALRVKKENNIES